MGNLQENRTVDSKEVSPEPSSAVTSCGRKKSDNGSFVTNLRDQVHDFINTPMEAHTACLKTTFRKVLDKFPAMSPASTPKEGENPVPLQKPVET